MAEEERILEVTPDFDGKRIDQCLAASFSDWFPFFSAEAFKRRKGFDQTEKRRKQAVRLPPVMPFWCFCRNRKN